MVLAMCLNLTSPFCFVRFYASECTALKIELEHQRQLAALKSSSKKMSDASTMTRTLKHAEASTYTSPCHDENSAVVVHTPVPTSKKVDSSLQAPLPLLKCQGSDTVTSASVSTSSVGDKGIRIRNESVVAPHLSPKVATSSEEPQTSSASKPSIILVDAAVQVNIKHTTDSTDGKSLSRSSCYYAPIGGESASLAVTGNFVKHQRSVSDGGLSFQSCSMAQASYYSQVSHTAMSNQSSHTSTNVRFVSAEQSAIKPNTGSSITTESLKVNPLPLKSVPKGANHVPMESSIMRSETFLVTPAIVTSKPSDDKVASLTHKPSVKSTFLTPSTSAMSGKSDGTDYLSAQSKVEESEIVLNIGSQVLSSDESGSKAKKVGKGKCTCQQQVKSLQLRVRMLRKQVNAY